jgi:rhamnosyl/mannosyltransferase
VADGGAGTSANRTAGGAVRVVRALTLGSLRSQPLTPTLAGLIRREAALLRPDLVLLHLPNPLAAGAWLLAGAMGGLPPTVLGVWHHADITRQRAGRSLARGLQGRCLGRAAGICVSSAALATGSVELAPWRDRVTVVPFGIDQAPWSGVRPRRDGPFLFVGRLVPYKGLEILIEAVDRLPDAELEVVGTGPLAGELARLVRARGLNSRVRLRGELDQTDLVEIMGRARAVVLPSLDTSETFGLVQLEAMAAGLAVVASDLPTGVREVGLAGETHLFVPPGDVGALAASLTHLLEEPETTGRLGEAARVRAADFERGIMIDGLLAWARRLTTRNGET